MLVVSADGSLVLMDKIRLGLPSPTVVHLFVNDYIPTESTVIGDVVEATFPGYSPALTAWPSPAFINGDGAAEIDAAPSAGFTSTGISAQTAYGYWIDDGTYSVLLWAERFASPVPFLASGVNVQIAAVLTGISAFSG